MPNVSFIVPAYNAEKYLKETLDSILRQTYGDWECICVDDGSQDCTYEIIRQFCAKDKRFIGYSKENEGQDQTKDFAIKHTSSLNICAIDCDDVIEPDYLKKIVYRQNETDADIVLSTMIICENELDGELWRLPVKEIKSRDYLSGPEACAATIGRWLLSANGMLYRRHLSEGISHGIWMNSDEFISRQLLFKAGRVVTSDAIYYYRQHSASISRQLSSRLWQRLYVDPQVEDFVFCNFPSNESIQSAAVSTTFHNLVYLAFKAYTNTKMDDIEREKAKKIVREAYSNLKWGRVKKYFPQYCRFLPPPLGYYFFIVMALAYHFFRKLMRRAEYECR